MQNWKIPPKVIMKELGIKKTVTHCWYFILHMIPNKTWVVEKKIKNKKIRSICTIFLWWHVSRSTYFNFYEARVESDKAIFCKGEGYTAKKWEFARERNQYNKLEDPLLFPYNSSKNRTQVHLWTSRGFVSKVTIICCCVDHFDVNKLFE